MAFAVVQRVTGHVFRIERKRGWVWHAKYRLRATLDEARRGMLQGVARTGVKMSEAAAESLRYSEHDRAVKQSTLSESRQTADRIVRELGGVPIEDVTREMLERWRDAQALEPLVAKYLVILHGIFKRALFLTEAFSGLRIRELVPGDHPG